MRLSILALFLLISIGSLAQVPIRGMPRMGGGGGITRQGGGDSLQFEKRDFSQDSVTVIYRYLDTARYSRLDTTISDFFQRVPLKPEYVHLGNNGNPVRPILFQPNQRTGWDAGFHAFDPFAFTLAESRFMNTTKPFTELTYLIGSKLEQQVGVLHTQNIRPDWNFAVQYRLVNSPGAYNSQNTNHSNIRFNTQYTSKDRRYNAFLIALSNGLQSALNGGIENDSFVVSSNSAYTRDRFNIPTRLADSVFSTRNFFSVKLQTGSRNTHAGFLLRQQYDLGRKDSVVTDSSVQRFFLPRLRLEHTVQYNTHRFTYLDIQAGTDNLYYRRRYGLASVPDTLQYTDRWKELSNDFSLVQFPDPKNPLQFLKAGVELRNHRALLGTRDEAFQDLSVHGEYRNRTRNRKWDMLLHGRFHAAGRYAGDYSVLARLRTELSKRIGSLELAFRNVNRTPSAVFSGLTSFPVATATSLNRENSTQVTALLDLPAIRTRLQADYLLMSNFTYFKGFREWDQEQAVFNMLRLGVSKEFVLRKSWKWYLDFYVQLTPEDAPLNLPLIYTRNRFAYEGRLFRNLNLSTGFDIRYLSPYKADDFSPVLGQFFLQDDQRIAMLPDVAAYLNFRVRNFTAFVRLENLNTLSFRKGFGFKNANFAAPSYPTQDLHLRLGVFWQFVN